MNKWKRPSATEVTLNDGFWTPYLEKIRTVMLPYVFDKFDANGYADNYHAIIGATGEPHKGPPFSDGLLLEAIRGAADFLALHPDPVLEKRLDGYIELIRQTADATDGFLCTKTTQECPQCRFGENGGDIVIQHDLYNHGALAEAAVSYYLATGKKNLLACAVRAANYICAYIGDAPKHNIIPGHSLPEEAFVKLYRLFRDHRALDNFAAEYGVVCEEYLRVAEFWYKMRGNRENRTVSRQFSKEYNQDHETFAAQRVAIGHAVRASLCYTGAAAVAYETGNPDFRLALDALWENVYRRKLHISGGIGTRHDIEGFDLDYNLPNDAYLETCAAVGFAFWAGEMSLLAPRAEYYEGFERALYNNILAAVAEDATHYFYENPLISNGTHHRWDWHGCPCCPPMLLKLFGTLHTYIYTYRAGAVNVNLFIDSTLKTEDFSVEQKDGHFRMNSHGKELTIRIRIPSYRKNAEILLNGAPLSCKYEDGYAVLSGCFTEADELVVTGTVSPRRVFANPKVSADNGLVAFFCGPFLLCAEGMDNENSLAFTVAKQPHLTVGADMTVSGTTADGKTFRLIPYYRWCRRDGSAEARSMAVWFPQAGMPDAMALSEKIGDTLYMEYCD